MLFKFLKVILISISISSLSFADEDKHAHFGNLPKGWHETTSLQDFLNKYPQHANNLSILNDLAISAFEVDLISLGAEALDEVLAKASNEPENEATYYFNATQIYSLYFPHFLERYKISMKQLFEEKILLLSKKAFDLSPDDSSLVTNYEQNIYNYLIYGRKQYYQIDPNFIDIRISLFSHMRNRVILKMLKDLPQIQDADKAITALDKNSPYRLAMFVNRLNEARAHLSYVEWFLQYRQSLSPDKKLEAYKYLYRAKYLGEIALQWYKIPLKDSNFFQRFNVLKSRLDILK